MVTKVQPLLLFGLILVLAISRQASGQEEPAAAAPPAPPAPAITTAAAIEAAPPPPRFLPAAWIGVDVEARRLMEDLVDPGTLVRFWTARSTVRGAENVFGPVIGLRTVGFGWLWRLRDGNFYLGLAAIVETQALFDREADLKVRPAVTLSLRGQGKPQED